MSTEHLIPWSNTIKLTWDDFQGVVDHSKNYRVESMIQVDYKWHFDYDKSNGFKIKFTKFPVSVYFDKSASWAMKETITSEESERLLKHELGHFDLGRIWGQILKERLEEELFGKLFDCEGNTEEEKKAYADNLARELVTKIHDKWDLEYDDKHDNYDKKTRHADIPNVQAKYDAEFDKLVQRK